MEKPSEDVELSLDKKKMIATMCIHNYIHENHALDKDYFRKCDQNIPTMSNISTPSSNDLQMDKFHDDIARAIFFWMIIIMYVWMYG